MNSGEQVGQSDLRDTTQSNTASFALNFLFGNCTNEGELEDRSAFDVCDQEIGSSLHRLGGAYSGLMDDLLGSNELGSLVSGNEDDGNSSAGNLVSTSSSELQRQDSGYFGSLSANNVLSQPMIVVEDFYDIKELASDEEHSTKTSDIDFDDEDSPQTPTRFEGETSQQNAVATSSTHNDTALVGSSDNFNQSDNENSRNSSNFSSSAGDQRVVRQASGEESDDYSSFDDQQDEECAIVDEIEKAMQKQCGNRTEANVVDTTDEAVTSENIRNDDVVSVSDSITSSQVHVSASSGMTSSLEEHRFTSVITPNIFSSSNAKTDHECATLQADDMVSKDTNFSESEEENANNTDNTITMDESTSDEDCENVTGSLRSLFSETVKQKFKGQKMKQVFPCFRKNKPLRFSKLFGFCKKYDLPHQFAHLKRRKRISAQNDENTVGEQSHSRKWFFEIKVDPEKVYDDYKDFLGTPFYISTSKLSHSPASESSKIVENQRSSNLDSFKNGPAKLWHDMYCAGNEEELDSKTWFGIPKDQVQLEDEPEITRIKENIVQAVNGNIDEDDARTLFMINQTKFENAVMWESEQPPSGISNKPNDNNLICAWVPSPQARTLSAYLKSKDLDHRVPDENLLNEPSSKKRRLICSFFPSQSHELLHSIWEHSICWDLNCSDLANPPEFFLDPVDDNLIPMVADEKKTTKTTYSPGGNQSGSQNSDKGQSGDCNDKKQMRRSKILLGKLENSTLGENNDSNRNNESSNNFNTKSVKNHRFNLSRDSFYKTKSETQNVKSLGSIVHHATPAVQLMQPFFPTYLSVQRLRYFHRWPLKRYSYGPLSEPGLKPVKLLTEYIELIKQEREEERQATGGGDMFYMRTADDLSGRDGDLILAEFSEQHPPLMNQIGMSSKIRHYYKKTGSRNDPGPPPFSYGEVVLTNESPQLFLGNIKAGNTLTVLENNMFKAPVYSHKMANNDFLIVRCRDAYYIRKVNTVFTVGQEFPLIEVPSPNSKRASQLQRDFLAVFIYRLFYASKDKHKRVKMEDIRAAFGPHYSESSIRKRLKMCSDFKRAGYEQNWWNLKSHFRLPNEEELRRLISPEECCAFYSMQAAEQRLRDAGYGDKAFTLDDNADETGGNDDVKVEDEIKCAPWNTTRAFLNSLQGKLSLDVAGIGDPTGCGEGFSFVRLPARMTRDEDGGSGGPAGEKKKMVTGTDADLRKLNLAQARQILVSHKIPEAEIMKLSRWEIIDVIRTLSTQKFLDQGSESSYERFARLGKYGSSDVYEKFKEECQRIFDQQNKVLASTEVLSSDDGSSSEDDEEDLSELAKNVETMMANRKTSAQIAREREEKERKELQKMIMADGNRKEEENKDKNKKQDTTAAGGSSSNSQSVAAAVEEDVDMTKYSGKVLKIYRTFCNEDTGEEFQRVETVRKPDVIHVYMSIRETKDVAWISEFADIQQIRKEEERKKRRRLQDQLRRLERNKQKGKFGAMAKKSSIEQSLKSSKNKRKKEKEDYASLKVTCGACGQKGHMKTYSFCPYFSLQNRDSSAPSSSRTGTVDRVFDGVAENNGEDLIKVEDTKITLGKDLLDGVERDSIFNDQAPVLMSGSSKKSSFNAEDETSAIYRKQYASGGALRKRTDPLIVLSSMFEKLIQQIKQIPGSEVFHYKVREKDVPDYYNIVSQPMDLQKMRDKCVKKLYKTKNDFLEDINLIVCNSITYNGLNHSITENANKISEFVQSNFRANDSKYSKLEKRINPLLDDNDQVGFSFLLREIVHKMKQIPDSLPFHVPVRKRLAPNYRSKVKYPMDLDTLLKNISRHAYRSQESFMMHVNLLLTNSELYNGPDHVLTAKAREIVNLAKVEISLHADYLTKLEKRIFVASQKAVESVTSSLSPTGFSELSGFSGTNLEAEAGSSSDDGASEPEGSSQAKKSRAMLTNVDRYLSTLESSNVPIKTETQLSPTLNRSALSTIYEEANSSSMTGFDSTFDSSQLKQEENSLMEPYTSFNENSSNMNYNFESQPSPVRDGTPFNDYDSTSMNYDHNFESSIYPNNSSSHAVSEDDASGRDFLINEESQDPEDMAKLLLGDISDSDNEDDADDQVSNNNSENEDS